MSRRLRRALLILALTPPILFLVAAVALYIPWVQDAATRYATEQLSERLGMQVRIGRLRLAFPADLSVQDLLLLPEPADTLLSVDRLDLGLSLRPVLSRRVILPRASVEGLLYAQRDSLGHSETRVRIPRGVLEELHLDLRSQTIDLGLLQTEGGRVFYVSTDTASSPSEPLAWRIRAEEIRLLETNLEVRLPNDSLFVAADVPLLRLFSGDLDLKTTELSLGSGSLSASHLRYTTDTLPPRADYLDPSHLALTDLSLELDDLHSHGRDLSLTLRRGTARERSGFVLNQLQGAYRMDSLGMRLSNLALRTEHSALYGVLDIPWSLLGAEHRGQFSAILDGSVGVEDVRLLSGRELLAKEAVAHYDQRLMRSDLTRSLDFALNTRGSLDSLWIDRCQLLWDGVLDLSARGSVTALDRPRQRRGSLSVEGGLQEEATTLLALVAPEMARQYRLPDGLTFRGEVSFGGGRDHLQLALAEGDGTLDVRGSYDELTEAYEVRAEARQVNLSHYMRQTPLGELTAEVDLSGRGLDWRSKRTRSIATLRLHSLGYAGRQLRDITLDGSLGDGAMALAVNSFNEGLNLAVQLDGLLTPSGIYSSIVLDAEELDLARWGIEELPLRARGQLSGELRTDYKQSHSLTATARDMTISLSGRDIRPAEVQFKAQTMPDTSMLYLSSGDLLLEARVGAGPDALARLSGRLASLAEGVRRQITDTLPMRLHLEDILGGLPEARLAFTMGADNALRPYLAEQRLSIGSLSAHLDLSAGGRLRGQVTAQQIRQDTLRISSASLGINTLSIPRTIPAAGAEIRPDAPMLASDSLVLDLTYALSRDRYRSAEGYTISGQLRTSLQEATGSFAWVDMAGRLRHQLSLGASWGGAHYTLRLPSETALIAYQSLAVNADNAIRIHKKTLGIDSDLRLTGSGGARLALESQYDASARHQEGLLQVQRLSLEDFRSLGLPDLGGVVFADVRYGRTGGWGEQPTITGDLSVQHLRYEDKELGHFATALFYEPRTDRSHYISAEMSYRGDQALSLDAIYYPERKDDALGGTLALSVLPLEVANPFLHRFGISLGGRTSGTLALGGTLSRPRLEGAVRGDEARIVLEQYATTLELDSLPIRFASDALHFDHYALRSPIDRQNPLYIDGKIYLSGPRAETADLRLHASDMMLLNQPRPRSERELLYGRLIASTDMTLRGRLDALKVRGSIDLQGGTNCTYVLREGRLDGQSGSDELLTFVDFADTLFVREPVTEARLGGLDVNLALHIDPSVRFGVDLTADGTDYMRVQGGGDLQLSYPPYGEMKLLGRYNMSGGGQLHYTIPVVGGKLFDIAPTGYLRFGGNVYNPYIQFKATQQVRAAAGSAGRKTNFIVGIEVKDHIEDIKLGFDLAAPEDLAVQNTLSTMTAEERGKQAIGLMATGIFLAGRSGANLRLDAALSSLLQSQINKAAGVLLRDTDINIGMEMHDGSSGGAYTDYTYSFSRRFYNDRIRVLVGGKLQSGNVPSSQGQTLIDNVALEYQLDKAGEQYLRLYHKRITDNVLEGEHTETGLGYLIKRKLSRPSDLFRFRHLRPRMEPAAPPAESRPWAGVPPALPADTTTNMTKNEDDR